MNSKIKHLYIFDFDGTLVNSPLPEEGKKIWASHYKTQYPKKGWWSFDYSLDEKVFEISTKKEVVEDFIRVKKTPDSLHVMLTSRLPAFEKKIKEILNKHLLLFDIYLFKWFGKSKSDRIDELLSNYPNIEYVEVWDDRDSEIEEYLEWKANNSHLNIKINHVK